MTKTRAASLTRHAELFEKVCGGILQTVTGDRASGMKKRRADFDLDATQDLYAEGRLAYALRLHLEAMAALRAKDLEGALEKLKESARAFPSPVTFRDIGKCLLRQGKPADAVLYLAAAVGMTPPGKHAHPLLLLVKALLRARGKDAALARCRELAAMFPDMKEALAVNPEEAVEKLLRRVEQQAPPTIG